MTKRLEEELGLPIEEVKIPDEIEEISTVDEAKDEIAVVLCNLK